MAFPSFACPPCSYHIIAIKIIFLSFLRSLFFFIHKSTFFIAISFLIWTTFNLICYWDLSFIRSLDKYPLYLVFGLLNNQIITFITHWASTAKAIDKSRFYVQKRWHPIATPTSLSFFFSFFYLFFTNIFLLRRLRCTNFLRLLC